ncbi:hypothetical protein DYB31_001831 [Aphanomyces astaci]|uniref:Adenylate kinase active site lid domain-containing protein n=1 Tax=Aphanomyces astaci TaxID=112090 RepID=A0A397FKM9_APHAT|nr:hypothetical protein DYB31_001831 [Aphanomyces astaci]
MCASCGTGYNVANINRGEYVMPPLLPKVDGVCDKCGSAQLVQRPDDAVDVVRHRYNYPHSYVDYAYHVCRLQVYADETEPLIAYYEAKGTLIDIMDLIGFHNIHMSVLGVLKNFHVTKGLADLDRLMQVLLSGVDSIESKL